jgi:hypothetical protein
VVSSGDGMLLIKALWARRNTVINYEEAGVKVTGICVDGIFSELDFARISHFGSQMEKVCTRN